MAEAINAVIFDMDGVLIDSEPLWRRAMIKGFAEYGLLITEAQCRQTTGQRLKEVVLFWLEQHQIDLLKVDEIENSIIKHLIELIQNEGKAMDGALELIENCLHLNLKIGLATSSSELLLKTVLEKLQVNKHFHAALSAEHLKHAKPHPEVFINCAKRLAIKPQQCLVIEDSINGMVAAKAAQMRVVVVPDQEHKTLKQFALADYFCNHLSEVKGLIKQLR